MANSGEKFRKLLTLLITWGLLMACFISYEVYFVKSQAAFLQEREFRALAALSRDLRARFDQARSTAESSIKLLERTGLGCGQPKKCLENLEIYLDLYLDGVWIAKNDQPARDKSLAAAIRCSQSEDQDHPLQFEAEGLTLKGFCASDPKTSKPSYTLNLTPWIQRDFQQLDGDFDDVLVADATGRVIFQKSPGLRIANLKSLLVNRVDGPSKPDEAVDLEGGKGSSKAAGSQTNKPSAGGTSELERLLDVASLKPITLAGESYQLFSRPVSVASAESADSEKWKLIVCGLRGTERLEAQSHTMPYSTLIWAILIVVALFSLSWPLFKLRYMSNTERFRPKEDWYLILAIFLASASVMLMLLNAGYTSWSRRAADAGLKAIAGQIKSNYTTEMTRAAAQLQQLGSAAFEHIAKNRAPLVSNYLGKSSLPFYPFFEVATYANGNGDQILKFDVRSVPTPNVNVSDRQYFQAAVSDSGSKADAAPPVTCKEPSSHSAGANLRNIHVEPLLSRNTHEFLAVLAARFVRDARGQESRIDVQALSAKPMSLFDPVLPPGYQFAVVDTDCKVLFHTQSFRNMQEDFCQESKYKDELRPWFFSGRETPLDISYRGQIERAYLTPMPPEPRFTTRQAFLIVFREPDFDLTLNLAIILVCSILMGAYFALCLLTAGVHLALRGPLSLIYAPRFIWPSPKHALGYVQLFVANGFMLVLFWQFYPRLYEGPLLILTFTLALLSAMFVVCRLSLFRKSLTFVGAALIGAALFGWIASALPDTYLPFEDWNLVFIFFMIAGLLALLLSVVTHRIPPRFGGTFTFDQVDDYAKRHFKIAHTLVGLSLITSVVLAPCIGCFKYAYDVVSELSLKHDQVQVTDALWARRSRIWKYYSETLQAPDAIRRQRMAEELDYPYIAPDPKDSAYRPSFTLGCGLDTPGNCSLSLPACKTADQHKPESSDDSAQETINHGIEKLVARVSLLLPSNQLGSEMSKLGVASSSSLNSIWKERTATCFTLSRQIEPGQVLTVTSEYETWQGLPFWEWVYLILLWVVLFVWLMSLAKKIFFTDIADTPRFPMLRWKSVADIQGNFLVIGRAKSGKSGWLRSLHLPKEDQLDLREELAKKVESRYYGIPVGSGRVLVLDHFEFNIKNPEYNQARLELIEDLLRRSVRLVVVSTVDPLYLLTEGAPGVLSNDPDPAVAHERLDRWARALSQFTKMRRKEPWDRDFYATLRAFIKQDPDRKEFAGLVKSECRYTTMLRRIGKELLQNFRKGDRATKACVASRVLDRADAYYHVLWSGLTTTERLALYQLALDGWANPNNAAALQQLERKELIYKDPMYRIMNESFRLFIQSTEHSEEIAEWERREQQSTWHAFRYIVIGAAVGGVAWLLYSQAALTQVVAGSIAAIVTLLTAVTSLFGRSGRQTSPVTKDAG